MKAKIKFVANFSWEFAEIEFSDEVENKINRFAEIVRERLLSVLGMVGLRKRTVNPIPPPSAANASRSTT